MRFCYIAIVAIMVLASFAACTRNQETPASQQVRVFATKAFESYFGPAPTTDKGLCYAFVIYFPSAKDPGKAVPFPFFTFDEASLKKVAVQRLIGGMAELKSYQGEIRQPFPPGTRLLAVTEKNGVVTVDFGGELLGVKQDEAAERALVNALVLTLSQFNGVKEVRIQVDGKQNRLDKLLQPPDKHAVLQPSAPRLLGVTAMREKGAKNVAEVDAFFDRPVEINSLQMTGVDGKPFEGEIYQSVFDMAGVLKPKAPELFKAGMPIKVRWNITDKLGRNASGESEIQLEVKEH
jgi:hypothetical protein